MSESPLKDIYDEENLTVEKITTVISLSPRQPLHGDMDSNQQTDEDGTEEEDDDGDDEFAIELETVSCDTCHLGLANVLLRSLFLFSWK